MEIDQEKRSLEVLTELLVRINSDAKGYFESVKSDRSMNRKKKMLKMFELGYMKALKDTNGSD